MERIFDKTNPRKNRKITNFAKEILINIGGKKQDIRKMIATAAKGTGIYEQIEMYGLNPVTPVSIEDTVMDFTQIAGDLRTTIEKGMLAKKMFRNLPLEIRKEFDHDENLFMQQGVDWMNNQLQKIKQAQQQQQPQKKEGE